MRRCTQAMGRAAHAMCRSTSERSEVLCLPVYHQAATRRPTGSIYQRVIKPDMLLLPQSYHNTGLPELTTVTARGITNRKPEKHSFLQAPESHSIIL